MTAYPLSAFLSCRCCCFVRTNSSGTFSTSRSSLTRKIFPAVSGECRWYTVCIRRCNPSAFNVPCFFSPKAIAERRRVILKCVVGGGSVVASDADNDVDGDAAGVLSDRHVCDSIWVINTVLLRHESIAAIPYSSYSIQNMVQKWLLAHLLKCFQAEKCLLLFGYEEADRCQRRQIRHPD
jgi:hypothetical protein